MRFVGPRPVSFLLVAPLAAACLLFSSCKQRPDAGAGVRSDDEVASESAATPAAAPLSTDDQAAGGFIAEAVGRLAELDRFYVALGRDDPANAAVLPSVVDAAAKTIRFDFTPFAAAFPEAGGAEQLSRLMTFPLPDGVPAGAGQSLSDPIFAEKFLQALVKAYAAAGGQAASIEMNAEEFASVYEACQTQNFKAGATITSSVMSGSDYDVKYDCRKMARQAKSGLTLSPFEVTVLASYTGEFYDISARLLRNRKFKLPTQDVAVAPNAKRIAIEGFLSLAILSGINKVDPAPEASFRGVGGFYAACDKDEAPVAAAATPAEAVQRFCEYFKTHTVYRECAFQSTSRQGNIALSFNGTLKDVQDQEFGQEGPSFRNAPLPKAGKVGVIEEISGHSGLDVAAWSAMPYEEEVLYKPGIRYAVKPGSAVVAIQPKKPGKVTDYAKFELVSCGTALTPDQVLRISHLRVGLVEN